MAALSNHWRATLVVIVGVSLSLLAPGLAGAGRPTSDRPGRAAGATGATPLAIAGEAQEGELLRLNASDREEARRLRYQWQRCSVSGRCTIIARTRGPRYRVQAEDVSHAIRVVARPRNGRGPREMIAATGLVLPMPPAVVSAPTIVGEVEEEAKLLVDAGDWRSASPLAFAYQWHRCDATGGACAPIPGATRVSYRVTAGDVDWTLQASVIAANAGGSSSAGLTAPRLVLPLPPAALAPPAISGTAREGVTLSAGTGSWASAHELAYSYQWRRCDAAGESCADLPGATGETYVLTSAEIDSALRVVVTASVSGVTSSAGSDSTAPVRALPPVSSSAPTIAGEAREGATLAAVDGDWTSSLPLSVAYQWQRCGLDGESCGDIRGATGSTYTLSAIDVGKAVRVAVTASQGDELASVVSAPTAPVLPARPTNTSLPSISGTPRDGRTLKTRRGNWVSTDRPAYSYRWQRCDVSGESCADIAGASASRYVLTSADIGAAIRVVVTATGRGGATSATSAQTAVVATSG